MLTRSTRFFSLVCSKQELNRINKIIKKSKGRFAESSRTKVRRKPVEMQDRPFLLMGVTAAVIAMAAVVIVSQAQVDEVSVSCDGQRKTHLPVFTKEALLAYDGVQQPSNPLYLVVLGEVFDVTSGEKHYRPKQGAKASEGYAVFLGKDSSRAFHDGKFDVSVADVTDLSPSGVLDVAQWRDFYRTHKDYKKVGLLEGLYYDCSGQPTATLGVVEDLIRAGNENKKYEESLTSKYVGCDSKYTAASGMSSMWCTQPGYVPRIMRWTNKLSGASSQRCACFSSDLMADLPPTATLEEYPDCAPDSQQCSFKLH
jgi:hypothetical protein